MLDRPAPAYHERVVQAAEAALRQSGSVGPLELFQQMRLLQPVHFDAWRKGNEHYRILEEHIQVGPAKFERAIGIFQDWVKARGLRAIEVDYQGRSLAGAVPLQVTANNDPAREKFYRTHYALAELPAKKAAQLAAKISKPPDLVVFEMVGKDTKCSECGCELSKGCLLCMEKGQPICMECADLDHLVVLPSGNTALTRRSKKYSPLSAVIVHFSRSRGRYERQGLLVTQDALIRAEEECAADEPERAAARARAAVLRTGHDREFVKDVQQAILEQFPACPPEEALQIAAHAAERGSGRVVRSAAGRALDPQAIRLAVIAHIRHTHTNYDELLMQGTERSVARDLIRDSIDQVLAQWLR